MATVCCTRSGIPTVVADAGDLPFRDESFDGVGADRTFQHLTNPGRAVAEIVRVGRPGARIVTVDPDYDTQVMEFPDQALARAVLRYRADHGLRNGKLAHQMAGLFRDVGLRAVEVEALTLTVRDPASVDNVMGLKTWARTAALNGYIATEQADVWEKLFDQTVLAGTFFYALTFFITIGVK
jgi:SAM-dependent methyltransferase